MSNSFNQALYNYARKYSGCHVLIDPLAGQDWMNCLRDLDSSELQSSDVCHEYFEKNSGAAPRVVHIPLEHFNVLECLANIACAEASDPSFQTRSVCCFMASGISSAAVAQRMARNLSVRVGDRRVYFRLFDPRVMHYLPDLLPSGALDLRGIESLAYFNWDGELAIHALALEADSRPLSSPIFLTEEQWRPFDTLAAISATVVAFKAADIPYPCSESKQLRLAVANVSKLGLREPSDVATYLLVSHQLSFQLAEHLRWNDALLLVNSGASLTEVLTGLEIIPFHLNTH